MHPEAQAVVPWLNGRVLEVGCGSNPTPGIDVALDHTPGGLPGSAGCEAGQVSLAGVGGAMHRLPFRDNSFDTLLARHVLEHDSNTIGVVIEWARVARRIVVVCPDQASYHGNTIKLDPTHQAAFTPLQLSLLVDWFGWRTIRLGPAVPNWSFLLVADRLY